MAAMNQIVSVWLDDTSDEHGWIVDTDLVHGGESDTIVTFPPNEAGFERAVSRGKREALARGCDLHISNGVSRIVLAADQIEADD